MRHIAFVYDPDQYWIGTLAFSRMPSCSKPLVACS